MTNTAPVAISLDQLVEPAHVQEERHALRTHRSIPVLVDGDLKLRAVPCECGAYIRQYVRQG